MSIESDYRDFMKDYNAWRSKQSKPSSKKRSSGRTVSYKGPGHTVVTYKNRILHIRFKQTKSEFEAAQARRRNPGKSVILVDRDKNGTMRYVSTSGREASSRAKGSASKGKSAIIKKGLSRDRYTKEDMRAILKDDHWEEVSNSTAWKRDDTALVKEFNKYLKWTKR